MSENEKIKYDELDYIKEEEVKSSNNESNEKVDSDDTKTDKNAQNNKILMTIGYIGILFLIPLCVEECKKSKFIRFHINQAILLFITELVFGTISSIFSVISATTGLKAFSIIDTILNSCFGLIVCILFVFQIIALWNNEERKLPLIGHFRIYK